PVDWAGHSERNRIVCSLAITIAFPEAFPFGSTAGEKSRICEVHESRQIQRIKSPSEPLGRWARGSWTATNQKVARSSRAGRIKFFSNLAQLTVIKPSSTDALTDALNCISQLSQDKRRDFMNYHEIPSLFLLCTRSPCSPSHASQ